MSKEAEKAKEELRALKKQQEVFVKIWGGVKMLSAMANTIGKGMGAIVGRVPEPVRYAASKV